MRRELEMPLQFPGVGIECYDGAGIEIVTEAHIAVCIRPGIARAPVDSIQFGIVRAGIPGGGAAALAGIGRPRVVRLALLGNGVEAPRELSGGGVVSVEKATHSMFSSRHADDHLIF